MNITIGIRTEEKFQATVMNKSQNPVPDNQVRLRYILNRVTELRHGWTSAQISKNFINFGTN